MGFGGKFQVFAGAGLGLVLCITALRHPGAARTGACYGAAPFIGAVGTVLLFGTPVTAALLIAGALMAVGAWLQLTERHTHDNYQPHAHGPDDPAGEPHAYVHAHAARAQSHRQ